MKINSIVKCDGCGADVEFHSTSALYSSCKYCSNIVAKDSTEILNYSKKSSLLKDYSKIKIGTIGNFKGQSFSVIGRLQLKYYYGYWNEWQILFDNGTLGWLSDLPNEYVITVEYSKDNLNTLKSIIGYEFNSLKETAGIFYDDLIIDHKNSIQEQKKICLNINDFIIDQKYSIYNKTMICNDISTGQIVGLEGELNFNLNYNQFKAVDLSYENLFCTLDFSEEEKISCYFGVKTDETSLNLSNYKTIEEIQSSVGGYKGKLSQIKCPSCGASNPNINGQTTKLICINCSSELSISPEEVLILKESKNSNSEHITTLKCGNIGTINNKKYIVIGVVVKKEQGEDSEWTEYLLYEQGGTGNLLWIVEYDGVWQTSKTINPKIIQVPNKNTEFVQYKNIDFQPMYDGEPYIAETKHVWGAFNWEINVGDKIKTYGYSEISQQISFDDSKNFSISKEIIRDLDNNHQEVTYSLLKRIPKEEIIKGFNLEPSKIKSLKKNNGKSFYMIAFFISLFFTPFSVFTLSGFILLILFTIWDNHYG